MREVDPFRGWTVVRGEEGIYVKTADGFERWYSRQEASEWAVNTIIDAAQGRIGSEANVVLVQFVVGKEIWSECLRAAGILAEEIERQADLLESMVQPGAV